MEASELNEILKQHRVWIDGKGGSRADLKGADLRGSDLTGANLMDANLYDANLTGANLSGANLIRANLTHANLTRANLSGANLRGANLTDMIGLPHISWIIPGCLAQLNKITYGFYLAKDRKYDNFVQDSIGFFIQDNVEEKTFDMLVEDRVIRGIPDWVKLFGLKQIESV
jgi:hypothetical protein